MIPNDFPSLNFNLGDTADMLRDTVRSFTSDKIAPIADETDRTNEFPRHLWLELGALGLLEGLQTFVHEPLEAVLSALAGGIRYSGFAHRVSHGVSLVRSSPRPAYSARSRRRA